MQQFKFDVVYFGTVVRDGAGNIVGIYPTEKEACEAVCEIINGGDLCEVRFCNGWSGTKEY